MNQISRLEIIGVNGREVVHYSDMAYDIQDNGKTLKVFIKPEHEDEILPMTTNNMFNKKIIFATGMKCPECNTLVVDEFPNLTYVGCSGCSRIFERG
jgi:protein-arginine kinase activator protein McsA